jgi:hypothetical protein
MLMVGTIAVAADIAIGGGWNEAVQGDLSSNALAPTPITFNIGVNHVSGTMGRDLPQDPIDRDIFTFTLADNFYLTSINVITFTPTNQSFYAIAAGTSIDINDPTYHLANQLVKRTGEFLPTLAGGSYSGGLGLPSPVPPGTYTIWFQELSSIVTYDMAYTVEYRPSVVPEPSAVAGLAVPAALLGRRRR